MTARPLIAGIKSLTAPALTRPPASHVLRASLKQPVGFLSPRYNPAASILLPRAFRPFHSTPIVSADPIVTSSHGEGDRNDAQELEDLLRPPPEPLDASRSAFLGESDSDDAFEGDKEIEGLKDQALDASHSAFLGESDSDDAFEVQKEVTGDTHEPLDASQAAFLGEGDSNDAFEGAREVSGDTHEALDPMLSGFHGETGEDDHLQSESYIWSNEIAKLVDAAPADVKEKVETITKGLNEKLEKLQSEVDDMKVLMGDREGVERDKFRL